MLRAPLLPSLLLLLAGLQARALAAHAAPPPDVLPVELSADGLPPGVVDDGDEYSALPEGFLFGAGSSSVQTEGAMTEGGKGLSVIDYMTHIDSRSLHKKKFLPSNKAADSYHRYKEDVAMAKALKLQVYRISIDWSRVLPDGDATKPNPEGVAFYNNLIDEILKNDIQPMVTMNHFDYPLEVLKKCGGWTDKRIVDYFEQYADFLFRTYGDRVKLWTTVNEPNFYCTTFGLTELPGLYTRQPGDDYKCTHHTTLAHAKAYRLYDRVYRATQGGQVGAAALALWATPNSTKYEDILAAERTNLFALGTVYHPVVFGDYPDEIKERVALYSQQEGLPESRLPVFSEEEKLLIKGSADFLSFNAYMADVMADGRRSPKPRYGTMASDRDATNVESESKPGNFKGKFMKCSPAVLHEALMWIWDHYKKPIFITENGWGDETGKDPRLDDPRVGYHSEYLHALIRTVKDEGVKVIGYLVWSLLDSYEWTAGTDRHFGLVYVDYEKGTFDRSLKRSSWFFQYIGDKRRVPKVAFRMDDAAGASSAGPSSASASAVLAALGLLVWLRATVCV